MNPTCGFLVAVSVCALAACGRQPEPTVQAEPPHAPSVAPPAQPVQAAPRALAWPDPPGWTRAPSVSPMRLATYRVPSAAGDPAEGEMTVFHFGAGQGGGVDANFDRWVGQFRGLERSKAVRSERTAHGLVEHVLEVERGTFVSAMRPGEPESPKDGYGLLGAIVETPAGSYFFKVTGPEKTLKAARAAFFALLDGVTFPS